MTISKQCRKAHTMFTTGPVLVVVLAVMLGGGAYLGFGAIRRSASSTRSLDGKPQPPSRAENIVFASLLMVFVAGTLYVLLTK
jgi:hypothetical protein